LIAIRTHSLTENNKKVKKVGESWGGTRGEVEIGAEGSAKEVDVEKLIKAFHRHFNITTYGLEGTNQEGKRVRSKVLNELTRKIKNSPGKKFGTFSAQCCRLF